MSADFLLVQDRRLGRYVLKRALGEGGYGQVFLAWQDNATEDPLPCVVKFPLGNHARDEQAHRRLLQEARLAMRLGAHPNIVHVIDVGEHEGMPFIVMEYIDGVDLEMLMGLARRRGRGLSLPSIYNIVASVAAGLHHAHFGATIEGKSVGIVHRDVKPANLLITRDGVTKLADFGIGVRLEEGTTGTHWRGTPRYMSPEHMHREVRPEMDVYGLGVVAWELVENRVYREGFEGPQHYGPTMDGRIPSMLNKQVPEQLVSLIKSCLDPNPRRRPSALELIKALSRCPGYSRDPDVLKDDVATLIGTRRSSGVSRQHLVATPELVATFAVLGHPFEPSTPPPAWVGPLVGADPNPGAGEPSPKVAPVETTLQVETDAPRALRRPWARRGFETTHVLGAPADAPVVDHVRTPFVSPPWFDHERATPPGAASRTSTEPVLRAGVTEQATTPGAPVRARVERRSYMVQTFLSIGVSIGAAALTAYVLGAGGDPPARGSVSSGSASPPVEPRPMIEPEGAQTTVVEPSSSTLSERPVQANSVTTAPARGLEPASAKAPVEPGPEPVASPAEAPAAEPVTRPKPPARPKPVPRVPVTLTLFLIDAAEIQIGSESSRISKKTEIRVPAGTHRVRWRLPGETDWRDAGRKRFEARHAYLVRLRSAGAEIIAIDGGSP